MEKFEYASLSRPCGSQANAAPLDLSQQAEYAMLLYPDAMVTSMVRCFQYYAKLARSHDFGVQSSAFFYGTQSCPLLEVT